MAAHKIKANLTEEKRQQIFQMIDQILELLDFLENLSQKERKTILRLGDKSHSFVQKACEYGESHPFIVPAFMTFSDFKKSVQQLDMLYSIHCKLQPLLDKINDTYTILGSEVYDLSRAIYNEAKSAVQRNIPGAITIAEDLGQRFIGQKNNSRLKNNETILTGKNTAPGNSNELKDMINKDTGNDDSTNAINIRNIGS